jgi:hypothetical protein
MEIRIMDDCKIDRADIRQMRLDIDKIGWKDAAINLFAHEPILAEHIIDEFAAFRALLAREGLSEQRLELLMPILGKLVLEPLFVLDRFHRELWADFLPEPSMQTTFALPGPFGKPRRRAYAKVEWEPRQLLTLRPDLTEFKAKLFLEYREIEIGSAMHRAGWEAMARLIKDFK